MMENSSKPNSQMLKFPRFIQLLFWLGFFESWREIKMFFAYPCWGFIIFLSNKKNFLKMKIRNTVKIETRDLLSSLMTRSVHPHLQKISSLSKSQKGKTRSKNWFFCWRFFVASKFFVKNGWKTEIFFMKIALVIIVFEIVFFLIFFSAILLFYICWSFLHPHTLKTNLKDPHSRKKAHKFSLISSRKQSLNTKMEEIPYFHLFYFLLCGKNRFGCQVFIVVEIPSYIFLCHIKQRQRQHLFIE